jgi:hypothetical protein
LPAAVEEIMRFEIVVQSDPRTIRGDKVSIAGVPLEDVSVFVQDGPASGFGIQESVYVGVYPELGLDADSNYSSDF